MPGFDRASRSFLLDLPAPVDDEVRASVVDRFTTIRALVGDRLDIEDAAALSRLLDRDATQPRWPIARTCSC